ncbi:cytochrome P450 [Astrocystis sublimbata]|nr:cytochrome P450 [Astrocystis sublimbata]KAI0192456.1 cytochrome P450 [Astrocystis sublimbata]
MYSSGNIQYALIANAIVLALIVWIYNVFRSPIAKFPGPWYTILTDAIIQYTTVKGTKILYVNKLHEKYGPIVRISPQELSLRDPSVTRKVYSVKGEFPKAEFYDRLLNGTPNVFSTRDIDVHRHYRRLLSSGLAESSLSTHLPIIESKLQLAIERMSDEAHRRGATDVFHWFLAMATDVIGELSFGQGFQMLETGEKNQYIRDLETVNKLGGIRVTFPFLVQLGHYIYIPFIKAANEHRRRTVKYAEQSIARHYRIVEEEGESAKPTLLSKLYKAGDDGMAFDEVRSNAMGYVIAGSDTTANTLTYTIWSVCKHPEVKARLLEELQKLPDPYDYTNVKSLDYLNLVIEEVLRLYPAAPAGLPRDVPAGGTEILGYHIPAGYTVSIGAYNMHRNSAVFANPETFDPLRWENPTKNMKEAFVPFGGGSRVCLGIHLARMELRMATAIFFRTFPNAKVSPAEGFCDEDMEPEMFFLLGPKSKRCLIDLF